MKPLYTQEQFNKSKSTDKLPCECYECKKTFYKKKSYITYDLKKQRGEAKFCSTNCFYENRITKQKVICLNCNIEFEKELNQIKKYPNHFCSSSCAGTYNNKHKTHGYKRSKLELWLEEQLSILYPNLETHFNRKDTINSELDIYIPTLNIAFELNGIFHYEPIYGVNKLQKIQTNDVSKTKACHDAKIDLCIIDTSQQKYVKPSTSKKYLDVIINVIDGRLLIS